MIFHNSGLTVDGVMISPTNLSAKAREQFEQPSHGFRVTHFTDAEILFDPTSHVYNGDTRLLSREEADKFLSDNKLKGKRMQGIHTNQPVAKYLGARPDDIIEIFNETFIPGTLVDSEFTHRMVIRSSEKQKRAPK